jgi:acetyl-CoA acetyltransferase family protein
MKLDREDIVLAAGVRTPFGTFGGALKGISANDLGVEAAKAAIDRSGFAAGDIDHVIFGNALQTSGDAIYCARHVGLKAGLPETTPAVTVNRLCGSGFESIIQAARQVATGESEVVLAGGAENMSQAPHTVRGARWGIPLGKSKLGDYLWESLYDPVAGYSMAETAENLAEKYGLSREEVDDFAYQSQVRTQEAQAAGRLADEIVPVEIMRKREPVAFDTDEHPRPNTTLEVLATLVPYFKKDGLVTAGNASGIVDGAAAVIVTTEERAERAGAPVLGRLLGWGIAGCDPKIMGIAVRSERGVRAANGFGHEGTGARPRQIERQRWRDRDRPSAGGDGYPLHDHAAVRAQTAGWEVRLRFGMHRRRSGCDRRRRGALSGNGR